MRNKLKMLLTACAVVTLCAGAVAFSGCGDDSGSSGGPKEHEHVYLPEPDEVKNATCTEEGYRRWNCKVTGCTEKKEETIQMTAHIYGPEKNTATCTEGGNKVQECTKCGAQKVGEATEALGHNMVDDKVTVQATCTTEGKVDRKCSRKGCDYVEKDVTLPMLEHNWVINSEKSVKPTCIKGGKYFYDCLLCKSNKTEDVDKLGHTPDYTAFEYPTFEKAGYCKGKCSVCGETLDDTMPMLVEGAEVEFQFKVVRATGATLTTYSMEFVITDWDGNEVAKASATDLKNGVFYQKLKVYKDKEYTMSASGLYGYESGSIKVKPEKPLGELMVKSVGLYAEDATDIPAKLAQGNLAQDFERTDIDGKTIRLSDYIKANKVVMLHFFYTTCTWCNKEYPGFVKAAKEYADKGVAVIGIAPNTNGWPDNDSIDDLKAEVARYKIFFPVVQDNGNLGKFIHSRYRDISGAPSTVFIDHEGVILKVQSGYLTTDYNIDSTGKYTDVAYKALLAEFTKYEWDDLTQSGDSAIPGAQSCDYMLPPSRKEY